MVLSIVPRRRVAEPHPTSPGFGDFIPPFEPSWEQRALSVVHRFYREWTEPEMLLGFGLGHIGWEAGRLLGLKGALAVGAGARAALWTGRAVGIAAEAATWAGAVHHSHASHLGKAWVENCAFATTLRSSQAAFRKAGPWGLALGTYAGLVVAQQAVTIAHTHRALPWEESLSQSAALFANFYAGGTMMRGLWGSSLARLEGSFQQKYHQARSSAEPSENTASNLIWAINGNTGSGNSPPPRRPISSNPPISSRPQIREERVPESGTFERPWRADDRNHLLRHIQRANSRFHEKIMEQHVFFFLSNRQDYSPVEFINALNGLAYLRDIPGGRRVQIQFEKDPSHHFTKWGSEFHFRERELGRSTPPENLVRESPPPSRPPDRTTTDLAGVRARMDEVLSRPRRSSSSSNISSSRPPSVVKAPVVKIPLNKPVVPTAELNLTGPVPSTPLKLVSTPQELDLHLQALATSSKEKFIGEILFNGTRAFRPEELLKARKFMETTFQGSNIALHDPHIRRTHTFLSEGGRVQGVSVPWKEPPKFEIMEIQSLIDLIQKLSFLRSAPSPVKGPLFADIRGTWRPYRDEFELEKFLNAQIHEPHPALELRQGGQTQRVFYDPSKRSWVVGTWK